MSTRIIGKNCEVWVDNDKIVSPGRATRTVDLKEAYIAPGVIDLQVNGGFGIDLLHEPERAEELARHLKGVGYAAFLPTLISARLADYERALPHLQPRKVEGGAEILGIHLEGPFLNPKQKGAHLLPEKGELPPLEGVKMVTLAPEMPGASELIAQLVERGIVVAAGHTQAEKIPIGVDMVTHLCNAMPPFHHRNPGLVGEILGNSKLPFSVIADGHHLHPNTLRMIHRCRPEGVILVSDGMAAMGGASGASCLGSKPVDVSDGAARLVGSTTLAGATTLLTDCVALYQKETQCSWEEAIAAATERPARLLGIEHRLGTLRIGADAELRFLSLIA